ncbi:MAG: ComEC/Rec2 family competence protein [Coriobacteriia bacterium]|nr:ComEC/Rec2 family competence protein [Coriobacteriia bacterium]
MSRARSSVLVRPSIPPVLVFALALWAAAAAALPGLCALGEGWLVRCSCGAGAVVVLMVVAVVIVPQHVVSQRVPRWARCVFPVALGLVLGLFVASMYVLGLVDASAKVPVSQLREFSFVMEEDATAGSYGGQGIARVTGDDGSSFVVLVSFSKAENLPRYGEAFTATTTLSLVGEQERAECWTKGVVAKARANNPHMASRSDLAAWLVVARDAALAAIGESGIDKAQAALAESLVCGYRVNLKALGLYDNFKTAGLAHVVAVSGAHLSIVSALFAAALSMLRVRKGARLVLQGLFVGGFLLFAAAPVSALRAAIMAWAGLLSFLPGRRASSLNALGLCVLAMVAADASVACSASFLLSALSTLGIVVFARLFQGWLEQLPWRLPGAAAGALSLTMAASLMTLPYSCCLFSQLPLITPVSNVLVTPLFALVCAVGLVGVALAVAIPPVAGVALAVAGSLSGLMNALVEGLASVPFGCIPYEGLPAAGLVVSAVCAVLLWRFWPMPSPLALGAGCLGLCAVLAASLFLVPSFSAPKLVALDVGQGDALLVQDGPVAVLVDTGTNDSLLRQALAREHITHLNAVVISHPDDDHCGSLPSLEGVVSVDRVIVHADGLTCACDNCASLRKAAEALVGKGNVIGVNVGDALDVGCIRMQVVWPRAYADEGGNADSLTLLLQADVDEDGVVDATALLCGDAEDEQLDAMLHDRMVAGVDIYKVGHHGSKAALDDETAQALSPAIALVSVGANNRYGHPAETTLSSLTQAGAAVFRTDECGDITCTFECGLISVSTQKQVR